MMNKQKIEIQNFQTPCWNGNLLTGSQYSVKNKKTKKKPENEVFC